MEGTDMKIKAIKFIGEAALSAFLGQLFDKLFCFALNFSAKNPQVHKQLKEWQSKLPCIQAILNDAEEKQIKNEGVKKWLADLKDLAYDVDDILDEFAYEALHLKLQKRKAQASTSVDDSSDTTHFTFDDTMVSKLEKITARLNDLTALRDSLGLSEMSEGASSKGKKSRPLQHTSVMDKAVEYVGREYEKEEILEWLKSPNVCGEDGVSLISVVGMGGIGKTTLAQLVYNHPSIKDSFTHKAWVCVSDDFDALKITKIIFKSVTSDSCDDYDLNLLQTKLEEELSGKRFLLVLDDIWNTSCNDWAILRSPFAAGTKIIVTTRFANVSSNVDAVKSFHLDKLSHGDCLSIFTQHALRARDFNKHPELEEVGKIIVRKCSGLPLASKVIGRLLRTSKNLDSWKKISDSEIWELEDPEDPSGIIPALRLSYHYLPPHLKRCFTYCSILPKDYAFKEEEIILLWRAEGLLEQNGGHQCFQDLVSRSFFQLSSNERSRFVMHDLINDLAQSVAGEICCKLNDDRQKLSNRTRYLSYVRNQYDGKKKFEAFYQVNSLRTFLPLKRDQNCYLSNDVLDDLLPKLKCLRVLSLNGYGITELPDFLKHLMHLRYLDFSNTKIKCLPDSLCILYHLETLILRKCTELEKLPSAIGNLMELHFLDISGAFSIKGMPLGVGKLTNLQRLSNFVLGEGDGHHIQSLKILSNLRGDFCLSGLKNVKGEDAREAKLFEKSGIDRLTLQWMDLRNVTREKEEEEQQWRMDFGNGTRNKEDEERVLDFLSPQKKIEQLTIENYGGAKFSAWIADSSYKNLLFLELRDCMNCKLLPPIGRLPHLKDLSIRGFNEVTNVGVEFFGENQLNAFASLETLQFEGLPKWTGWEPCEGDQQVSKFPNLRELYIKNCPQLLERLPSHLRSLQKLEIYDCKKLVVSISSFTSLCELKINGCEELVDTCSATVTSLRSLCLLDISKFTIPPERIKSGLTNLEYFEVDGRKESTSSSQKRFITIQNCPQLVSLEKLQFGKNSDVESLTIKECARIERLPKVFRALRNLTGMEIAECASLVSFAENNLPPMLKTLKISDCGNLKYVVDTIRSPKRKRDNKCVINTCFLEHLTIVRCRSLVCLSRRGDAPNGLRLLQINICSNLTCLFSNANLPMTLKELEIWQCPNLESISQNFHETTSLESIKLLGPHKMQSLPRGLDKLSHLREIIIERCRSVVSFEESGLPPTTNLRVFSISGFENFGALFGCMYNFTSLRKLKLFNCSADISVGFPTNLTSLEISNAPKIYASLAEWGLDRLTSLQSLDISGEGCIDVESFPEENKGMMLPASLTSIHISNFENLKCMSSRGFRNLTSLQHLCISGCANLTALPEKDMLLSLGRLEILKCPRLEKNCKRVKGKEWSKIAHIPSVDIDKEPTIPRH